MPNTVTKKIKIDNAKRFVEDLKSTENSLYLFIGRPQPWEDERNPPAPDDSAEAHAKYWDEMIALKRINPTDVIPVVKRYNWTLYETYTPYDNEDVDLFDKKFYVMNSNYEVYKCIDNFNGSVSTVEPAGKSTSIVTTSDGYKWKYLYSIPIAEQLKFLTRLWMPVLKEDLIADAAKDGGIEKIKIFNGGTNYSSRANVTVTGDGSGANIQIISRLGTIQDFRFVNSGTGYRYATVTINDTTGRFANVKPVLSPVGGHGKDPISELGAHTVMINSRLEYREGFGDFPADIKFRTFGIVRNPKSRQTNSIANTFTLSALNYVTLSNLQGQFNNEFAETSNTKSNVYIVTSLESNTNANVYYIQSQGLTNSFRTPSIRELLVGRTSGALGIVTSFNSSEVLPDTGDILYVEHRSSIQRLPDQIENVHLVLDF